MHLPPLVLTAQQRDQLETVLRRPTSTQRAVERALIVLDSADGRPLHQTAERLGLSRNTVRKWRRRFILKRAEGLEDQPRPGRPRRITAEERCLVVATACQDPAEHDLAGHSSWSGSLLAQVLLLSGRVGAISARSVQRILKAAAIKPHRIAYWKQKIDPLFDLKMRPPFHASWLNQIELWFATLSRRCLRLGDFSSGDDLVDKILAFIETYDRLHARPYRWTYTGEPLAA